VQKKNYDRIHNLGPSLALLKIDNVFIIEMSLVEFTSTFIQWEWGVGEVYVSDFCWYLLCLLSFAQL